MSKAESIKTIREIEERIEYYENRIKSGHPRCWDKQIIQQLKEQAKTLRKTIKH